MDEVQSGFSCELIQLSFFLWPFLLSASVCVCLHSLRGDFGGKFGKQNFLSEPSRAKDCKIDLRKENFYLYHFEFSSCLVSPYVFKKCCVLLELGCCYCCGLCLSSLCNLYSIYLL